MAGRPLEATVPAVIEIDGFRSGLEATPRRVEVASFADAEGDLPLAGSEVEQFEAHVFLRGPDVRLEALRSASDVGLLHLGLHGRRDFGLPSLTLADGPLTSVGLSALRFTANPVVLLSGCATGKHRHGDGSERSLAEALLQAGASAVVATRWPLQDDEGFAIFRPIVTRWPFADVAEVVSDVMTSLRRSGAPTRVWAAPVVYRR